MPQQTQETTIRQAVRERYARLATKTGCCGDDCCSEEKSSVNETSLIPEESLQVAAGCGSPISYARIMPGQTVVDLGSGGGIDVFRAAQKVGPQGRAIGIDATPEMIWRARETASKDGYSNVEFRLGEIEHMPLETDSADWIVSNCVINLAPDKLAVFKEAFRVLKPGGKLVVSDIISEKPVPQIARRLMSGWSACLTGAIPKTEYLAGLAETGFTNVQVLEKTSGVGLKLTEALSAQKLKLSSLTISAEKPSRV